MGISELFTCPLLSRILIGFLLRSRKYCYVIGWYFAVQRSKLYTSAC